jgi:hypothetical protein
MYESYNPNVPFSQPAIASRPRNEHVPTRLEVCTAGSQFWSRNPGQMVRCANHAEHNGPTADVREASHPWPVQPQDLQFEGERASCRSALSWFESTSFPIPDPRNMCTDTAASLLKCRPMSIIGGLHIKMYKSEHSSNSNLITGPNPFSRNHGCAVHSQRRLPRPCFYGPCKSDSGSKE